MLKIATVHGRFQPPHLDHLEYMEAALYHTEHLVIGITQPDVTHLTACPEDPHRAKSDANPLSYTERCESIECMLLGQNISRDKFSFVRFPIEQPEILNKSVPIGTVCFTTIRDEWNVIKVDRLHSLGYDVRVLWNRRDQSGIQGTEIRRLITRGEDEWKTFVHPAVVDYLITTKIISRMQKGHNPQ